jgi:hypothetical protein
MRWLVLVVLFARPLPADIVDRIVASIGYEVITESEVARQIRVTSLIDGVDPDLSLENRRKTLERLIEQALLRREVEFTRFPPAVDENVAALAAQVRARTPDEAGYRAVLARYGVSQEELLAQLRWHLTMLRFIEYRFQPAVQVSDSHIRQEYRRQVTAWRERNAGEPPAIDTMRPELEKIARQQLTDSALDRWLGEVRTQSTILYRGEYR